MDCLFHNNPCVMLVDIVSGQGKFDVKYRKQKKK